MKKYEMTVHEALSELKVLGARIDKGISAATFVGTNKHSNAKIDGLTVKEYEDGIKADYQSISDLIARRSAIKKAVTLSNAKTEIIIKDDKRELKMTVAEAIEYKATGIAYKQKLLDRMALQYSMVKNKLQSSNGEYLEEKANDYIHKLFGNKDKDVDAKTIEASKKVYIEGNTLDLIDPIKIADAIKALSDEIDFFNSKVDSAISVSNAVTIITFEV